MDSSSCAGQLWIIPEMAKKKLQNNIIQLIFHHRQCNSLISIPKTVIAIQTQQNIWSNYANIYVYIREENLPLNDFGKGKLKECDHGIKNPVGKPLLIINVRFSLNCPN